MGFLSGITKSLFGGSDQSSEQQSTSGFGLLPKEIQDAYKNYGTAVNAQIPNVTAAYTPTPISGGEQAGLDKLTTGFTPTAESLNSDISMLMNPFNDSVIGQLNRQAGSDFSILKQNSALNGQFGSNRQQLGANDIENSRQGMIGSLLQNQYNTAINQVLNNLVPQRQQDALDSLTAGSYQRDIADKTKQAPIFGLQQLGAALGILPSSGGSQSTGTSSGSSNNGIFKPIGL